MGLRLICGKSGSGKTSYCFKEIKEKIHNSKKIYIITPEQFSFTQEKHLLDILEEKSVINAEVLTFDRMAYRVFQEVGGLTNTYLSEAATSMLIYDILDEQKQNLTFLGKSNKNVNIVGRMFTELKKHKIELEKIKDITKKEEDMYLKKKLEDIIVLRENFEKKLPLNYIEGASKLTKLAEEIEKCNLFDDCIFYLDEFAGFTKQEYDIIEKILRKAKEVNITICIDKLEENKNIETDLFYANNNTALKLLEIAKKNNIKIEKTILLNSNYRFKNAELSHLEKNIYRTYQEEYNLPCENISLFLAKNPYSEIENLAKQILYLVREKGYRYKEISIITKDIENYRAITKAVFEQYEIPIFIDQKRDLNKNILVKFLLSIFDIFAKNWSYDSVFSYLKTGLTPIYDEEINKIENYCIQWGIKGRKWYTEDWNYGNLEKSELEELNYLRKIVVEPLIELKNEIKEEKSVKTICEKIYYFLEKNEVLDIMDQKIQNFQKNGKVEIANEYETSIKVIFELLDEMVNVFGDKKISFEKYRELLKIGLENKTLGVIPGLQDEVIMGDVDRSRSHKVRAVFILGLNDGIFPSVNKEEGFLNDKDRDYLKSKNIELAKNSIEQLYDERFNIYKAFSIAEEKLYLSYTSVNKEGKAIRGSVLIQSIKKIFPKLIEKSDIIKEEDNITLEKPTFNKLLERLYEIKQGKKVDNIWTVVYNYYKNSEEWSNKLNEALKGLKYTNLPEKIEQESVKELYGEYFRTSISQLEKYRSCPFAFHLKYGLKLKSEINPNINAIDTGNFIHEVIDSFFYKVKESKIELKEMSEEMLEEIVSEIIEKKLQISIHYRLASNPKFKTLTRKLKKIIIKSMKYIVDQLVNSEFEVFATELEFKNKSDYPPIVLELEDKRKIEIVGKIDRVDLKEAEDGKYIRIIDYKSSIKKLDLNEALYGLNIQLITYIDEMSEQENAKAAGVLYFNIVDYIISSKKKLTEEEIEKELKKQYKMQGLLVNDVKIIKMMDKKLENGNFSEILPVYLDKDGNISQTRSNTIDKEDFELLQKEIREVIKQISKEILKGEISLKPYYDKNKKTPCMYCEYNSICNFSKKNKGNEYYYIPNLSKNEIIEKLRLGKE